MQFPEEREKVKTTEEGKGEEQNEEEEKELYAPRKHLFFLSMLSFKR